MIYLKRVLFLFNWLLNIVFIILPITFVLFITYPFYLIVYYIAFGELGNNLSELYDKCFNRIFSFIDLLKTKIKRIKK